jgi:hypothetical protein
MKYAVVFAALFTALSFPVFTLNWPSEEAVLYRNFGSNVNGMPALGIVFSGGTDVLASESGEVIFSRNKKDTASRLPSPLGAWTAVDHGDGLISIYSRYDDKDGGFNVSHVEKQQPIASAGTSGWSSLEGFYFIIYDRRERRWINPEMIITPLRETRPPQILSVDLLNNQGILMQSRSLNQGRYTVIVNSYIPAAVPSPQPVPQNSAPQRIVCSVNGAEVGSLNFEAVSARDGTLMVYRNGLVPARQIYAIYPAYEVAEVFLSRGQVNLEVIVQDITGNSRSVIIRLFIN